jgi:hypothetical protein
MDGTAMLLKSLGLGPALDAVKDMASNGTLDKIVKFAEGTDALLARQNEMERKLDAICAKLGIEPGAIAGTVGGPVNAPEPIHALPDSVRTD